MDLILSPAGLTAGILLVILALLFRRRLVAILTTPVPNPNYDPVAYAQGYWPRSRSRMERAAQEAEQLERLISKDKLDVRTVSDSCARLRKLANEQRKEVVPTPILEGHKQMYFRLMDIQARKAEDLLDTGGENLMALRAEEEELRHQADANAKEVSEVSEIREVEEVRLAFNNVLVRADNSSKPWKERPTTKPSPEYRSQYWSHWVFFDYEDEGRVVAPEFAAPEMIGSVFPDDFITVNREWRRVHAVITTQEEPVMAIELHGEPVSQDILKRFPLPVH